MDGITAKIEANSVSMEIRVRGTVQGVGFRPMVWRLAREYQLAGDVSNDGAGVLIHLSGSPDDVSGFLNRLESEAPPLCRIDHIETAIMDSPHDGQSFQIVESRDGETRTQVTPDAATCQACRNEVLSSEERRFRYPFTNCTHCGPRFSIIKSVPYDRAHTTMANFEMCPDCRSEYENPNDRRFHAQPIACHKCGPKVWLEQFNDEALVVHPDGALDDIDMVTMLIQRGEIVAIRGMGGFHLACDASNDKAVERLRERKRRYGKPFALMARDVDVIRRYCSVDQMESNLLASPEAPIVLLNADGPDRLPDCVAPGMNTLGFMLPYMPLHHLILNQMDGPIIMTSGNMSDEPQVISRSNARKKLNNIADYALFHDREIANRIDDSVVRVMAGEARLLRRARGYAPGAIALPKGFEDAPELLAFGGELKSTFCMVKDGAAILSQHQGDLEDPATLDDYQKNLMLYKELYDFEPSLLAADMHPEYLSTKMAKSEAGIFGLPLIGVQHHHAHIASCMAENGVLLDTDPVLGVALDGLGLGADGRLWGGEFMLADYRNYKRLGTFKPVAMLGGAQAIREPWRNTYAHIMGGIGWEQFSGDYSGLELFEFLQDKPRKTLDQMLRKSINSPLASSCGRLFDAVAAALGLCRDKALYEGQGAMELEAIVDENTLREVDDTLAYRFSISNEPENGLPQIDPLPMWQGLLHDLVQQTPVAVIAARFHKGLAMIIADMVSGIANKCEKDEINIETVALSGGCFQNKILLEEVSERLSKKCYKIIMQSRVPANDGGLALGQAAIAAAVQMSDQSGPGGF